MVASHEEQNEQTNKTKRARYVKPELRGQPSVSCFIFYTSLLLTLVHNHLSVSYLCFYFMRAGQRWPCLRFAHIFFLDVVGYLLSKTRLYVEEL